MVLKVTPFNGTSKRVLIKYTSLTGCQKLLIEVDTFYQCMSQRVLLLIGTNSLRVLLKATPFSGTSKRVLIKYTFLTGCHKVFMKFYQCMSQ